MATANARHGHTNIFFSESLAGAAQARPQCSCNTTRAVTEGSLHLKAGPKEGVRKEGKEGQPLLRPPRRAFGKSFPQGHQLHCP